MPNLATGLWQDSKSGVVICVENALPPTAEEWTHYCAVVAQSRVLVCTGLAVTDGGGPNATQRKQVLDALGGVESNSTVVSESLAVRGVVTALSWFHKNVKAFHPNRINDALAYCHVEGERARSVWKMVEALGKELNPPSTTIIHAARYLR